MNSIVTPEESQKLDPFVAGTVRSVEETVARLDQMAQSSASLVRRPLPSFHRGDREHFIPRYLFIGPRGGAEPIRVGLFAGVHGDEPEGTYALAEFLEQLDQTPAFGSGYCLFAYPILNPTGFEKGIRSTSDGVNIPNEIWKNTTSPEVFHVQSELWMHGFDGIVSFKTDPSAQQLTAAIAGPVFARHMLGVALRSAQDVLPQSVNAKADALPKWRSATLDEPNELIRAAPGLKTRPFELVITIPRKAPFYAQKAAVCLLLKTVLEEYRSFIAFGAGI